jgi:hypothetical protein
MPAPTAIAYLNAYRAERDVVVASVTRQRDGSYEVWAQGERVNVAAPAGDADVGQWAHAATDAVVARLGNRILPG